ncbi:MAG: hypothetical protein V3V33_16770 [Candidatus Lokiarchaeia archaeon]
MIKITYFTYLLNKAREKNVYTGIVISVLVSVVSYIIISIISLAVGVVVYRGYFLFADLEYLLGTVFGVIFFLKNRREDQSILKFGIIVGIVGAIISSIFISLYQWILLFYFYYFLVYLAYSLISGVFIGLLFGAILSAYFMYKEVKGEKYIDDDFYKDLIEDK